MCRNFFFFFLLVASTKAYYLSEEECLNYTIYPVQYELIITPYILNNESFYYDCDIIITVIANAPNVNVIELDSSDLEIKEGSLQVLQGNYNLINVYRPYEYEKKKGKLRIYLKEALQEYRVTQTQYQIKMSFRKIVKYDSTGVFVVRYNDGKPRRMPKSFMASDGKDKVTLSSMLSTGVFVVRYNDGKPRFLFVTRLSPINKAKYFFPCIENPQFEAVFKFKVYEAPPHPGLQYTNTSLVIAEKRQKTSQRDNFVVIDYVPSPQVGLHQVGFHYSQFQSREVKIRKIADTLVIWAPASRLQHYSFILGFGESIINLIHDYSTINRPLVNGKINIIAVPTNLNGYEIASWNLLTNGENRLAYIQEATSIKQLERMTFELTQQLCRIWLGNPGETERTRWTEEWFKEGVATYLAYYFLTQYNHGSQTMVQKWPLGMYGLEMKHKAMATDWYHSKALITFNRTLAVQIPSRYKELVTMKTAAVLWMVENWVGSEKFHHALVEYIKSRRGKYISLADFFNSLDFSTMECQEQFLNGLTASNVLQSWFHRPGYPVVNVQVLRDRVPNAVHLTQRQFSFTESNREDSNYRIPISYVVQNNEKCFNCHRPRFTINNTYTFEENLNGGWIILNRKASGYYRVNYDVTTWKLIANTLQAQFSAIDELDRAQIVHDVFALYAAGDMDFYLANEILDYLNYEDSHVVWQSVMSGFELLKIDKANCNMTKAVYNQWEDFLKRKVSPVYNRLMGDIEQQLQTRLFRSNIEEFACAVGDKACLENVMRMYESTNENERLEPDSRIACYNAILKTEMDIKGQWSLNNFELDDMHEAERRVEAENKFLYRIPAGQPKPPRIESTTPPIPAELITNFPPTTPSFGDAIVGSLAKIIMSGIIIALVR